MIALVLALMVTETNGYTLHKLAQGKGYAKYLADRKLAILNEATEAAKAGNYRMLVCTNYESSEASERATEDLAHIFAGLPGFTAYKRITIHGYPTCFDLDWSQL